MTIKDYVAARKAELIEEINELGNISLTIIKANEDAASEVYVRNKIRDCEEVGIKTNLVEYRLEDNYGMPNLIQARIFEKLTHSGTTGVMLQMPVYKGVTITPTMIPLDKDVDGMNLNSKFDSCTPLGIINYLKHENVDFSGKNAVIIGRSNIVGKPMARLLLNEDCSVTVCHSKTPNNELRHYLENADIIVVAVGRKYFLDKTYKLKESAIVVDVGINRDENGKLCGDCEPNLNVAMQTPVPNGVGLLTRLALLENLVKAKELETYGEVRRFTK